MSKATRGLEVRRTWWWWTVLKAIHLSAAFFWFWAPLLSQSNSELPIVSNSIIVFDVFLWCVNTIDGFAMFDVFSFLVPLGWGTWILKFQRALQHLLQLYRTLRPCLPAEPSWLRWWELCGWGPKNTLPFPCRFRDSLTVLCFFGRVHELKTQLDPDAELQQFPWCSWRSWPSSCDIWCVVRWAQYMQHSLTADARRSPQTSFLAVSGRTKDLPTWMGSCHHSRTMVPF